MILPRPARKPDEPLTPKDLMTLANDALALARIIRDFLPIDGDTALKTSRQTLGQFYADAFGYFSRCERVRNPESKPYHRGRSLSLYWEDTPEGSAPLYMALGDALDDLCEHYGWQGPSDDSARPGSICRNGGTIPPVPERLVKAIEVPAQRLIELEFAAGGSENKPLTPIDDTLRFARSIPIRPAAPVARPRFLPTTPHFPR